MVRGDSQIDKPQRGRPKRVELPDANNYINTGAQSNDTESFFNSRSHQKFLTVLIKLSPRLPDKLFN